MKRTHLILLAAPLLAGLAAARADHAALREALLFHASFDNGLNAEVAKGDPVFYSAPRIAFPPEATPGLPPAGVSLAKGEGRFGDCLKFEKGFEGMVFFKAAGNTGHTGENWGGTVSFWLRLTPDEDLAPGYTDPIQLTSKGWDKAAFFVEFTKDEKPREFRLGAYADFEVWNPENRDWDKIPFHEKPLLKVVRPPFSRDVWTHVAFTWENYNTGKANGVTRLYLNGELQGELSPRQQTFSWDLEKAMVMLGLSYAGHWDELAMFSRALAEGEVAELFKLPQGVASLGAAKRAAAPTPTPAQVLAALRAGENVEALRLAAAITTANPADPQAWFYRGVAAGALRRPAEAAAAHTRALELLPGHAQTHQQRGFEYFRLGKFAEAIADFDAVIASEPSAAPHHWQRGIALYYAGRFADGRKQFEIHQGVNASDVENAAWHFLCVARESGLEEARKRLIPITGDFRIPMMEVQALLAGASTPDKVMEKARAGDPGPEELKRRLFYAHLYLGLYAEAAGDKAACRSHIEKAAGEYYEPHYMGDVAKVHLASLGPAAAK